MAYPVNHYLLTFGGTTHGAEQWTCGFRLAGFTSGTTAESDQTVCNGLATTLSTRWNASGSPVHSATLNWVKYNLVGTDGKYVRNVTISKDLTPAVTPPAVGGPILPPQVALVATLRTAAARGLASRGRIFLPNPHAPGAGATGTMSGTQTAQYATWVAALINAINNHPGSGDVAVFSKVRGGAVNTVTGVDVGNIYDTMRSRRNKLVEVRSSAAVTATSGGGGF